MKKRQIVVILMVSAGFLNGCAGSKSRPETEAPASSKATLLKKLDESFDPATLNEPDYPIKPKKQKKQVDLLSQLRTVPQDTGETASLIGYRIQIMQTEDAEEARKMQKDAILELDADVYLIYDEPYYKVRVGDFRTRYEAEQFLEKVQRKGYASAWIVRTRISPREQ